MATAGTLTFDTKGEIIVYRVRSSVARKLTLFSPSYAFIHPSFIGKLTF